MRWFEDDDEVERNIEVADLRYKLEAAIEALEYIRDLVTEGDILEAVEDALQVIQAD